MLQRKTPRPESVANVDSKTPPPDSDLAAQDFRRTQRYKELKALQRADHEAANIFANSLQRMVIGPAFDPDSTMADVMARVKIWARTVNGYGFTFLNPLLTADDPKAALGTLTPSNQLETDILNSLRAVMEQIP